MPVVRVKRIAMSYSSDYRGRNDGRGQGNPRPRRGDAGQTGSYRPSSGGYREQRPSYGDRPVYGERPRAQRPSRPQGAPGAYQQNRPQARPSRPSYGEGQRPQARPRYDERGYADRGRRPAAGARPAAGRAQQRPPAARPSARDDYRGRPATQRPRYGAEPRGGRGQRGRVASRRSPLAGGKAVLMSGIVGGRRTGDLARHRRTSSGARSIIAGIVCVAIVAIVAVLLWSNRKVNITLNGETYSVRVGSTCEQVIADAELSPTAGNLVSVSGNKLEDGAGYAFTATLAGNQMSEDDISNYRVSEGDSLDISDGGDRTEDYDVQVMDEQPQLEMGGDAWGNISYISQWPKVGQYEMRTGKQSGETARGDTLSETQNAVVSVHQISPDNGKKLVALTFDDGPAEKYTDAYLDILDQYNIHATFFCLGQNVEAYPDLAKKICDRGSEVMSHTYQHQELTALDASALQQEFSSTFSNIESTTGVKTTGFRPPYGAFSEKAWLNSGGLASVSVLWNQDSLDWKRPGADVIVENCLKNVTSGSIILMHDGGGNRDQDVEALPRVIESLQSQGYEFVTVSDLMKSDSSIPADIAGGDATMPDGCVWPTQLKTDDSSSSSDSSSSDGSDGSSGSSD